MALETYKVYQVDRITDFEVDRLQVHFKKSNGENHCYTFPHDTMEHRAAEYGFDISTPEARAEVMDLILHEQFMPAVSLPAMHRAARGRSLPTDEVYLWNAPSQQHAREAYLAKLAHTKQNLAVVQWSKAPQAGTLHPMMAKLIEAEPDAARVEALRIHHIKMRHGLGLEPTLDIDHTKASHANIPERPHDPSRARRSRELRMDQFLIKVKPVMDGNQ